MNVADKKYYQSEISLNQSKFSCQTQTVSEIFVRNVTKIKKLTSIIIYQISVRCGILNVSVAEFCYLTRIEDCQTFFWKWEENENKHILNSTFCNSHKNNRTSLDVTLAYLESQSF
jgi:hypothetical protein